MAIKIVCDICGKDCLDENSQFFIPIIEPTYATTYKEVPLKIFYNQTNKQVDLCSKCQTNIANFIKLMKEGYNEDSNN